MTAFRVFFDDGTSTDVDAEHPDDAREIAAKMKPKVRIGKVKRVKEREDA